jgi:hypothetical protein
MSTEFEDRLREEMRHATEGALVSPGLVGRARGDRRRRRVMTSAAVAATAATAAVAAAIVATGATEASRESGIRTTAYIVSHVDSALGTAGSAQDIAYLRGDGGLVYRWLYSGPQGTSSRNKLLPGGGRPGEVDTGSTTTRAGTTSTSVNYHTKTWWRRSFPDTSASPASGALSKPSPRGSCTAQVALDVQPSTLPVLATDIRRALACGQLTSEGTENVDGVNAIKLGSVQTMTQPAHAVTRNGKTTRIPATTYTTVTKLWVDPASYLPVRFVTTTTEASVSDPGSYLTGSGTWDVQWLPPTSANLALLTVKIPPGFTQVAPPTSG